MIPYMPQQLKKEMELYEKHKNELLAEGEGKFVVIKGSEILKFFGTEEDALKEGYSKFGSADPFLVKKVCAIEQVCYFSPSPLHNAMFNPPSR